jgi:predicted RNase H-like nuclease (RuvC/YqgF family)
MQQLQAALRSARTAEERAAIRQQFEDRMPYSNRVRQLQEQAQSLQQQLQQTSSESARRTLARRIDGINQQIRQDSSYQTVSRARNEVFQQMNR